MNYSETLEYLYNRLPVFHQIGAAAYKPGLGNSIKMMKKLGNPHQEYSTIHVAGTNGKGSVSHFMAAILQSAGYKVGLYTSPHLVDFRERIRVNGEMIEHNFVIDFIEQHKSLFDTIQPSFFEATMAIAFDYFQKKNVDVAVIEVGLGGRLDSTNIISPVLSIITNIGLDHTEFLGKTLPEIAFEKAGIIKEKTPIIIGETNPETKPVFVEKAKELGAEITFADEKYKLSVVEDSNEKMIVQTENSETFEVGLFGNYQLKNISTVLSSVEKLKNMGYAVNSENIHNGLKNVVKLTELQGRWHVIQQNPTVILDTGHNLDGIKNIVVQLSKQRYNQLYMIFGMVDDKDIYSILPLLPKDANYFFTAAKTKRAISAEKLTEIGKREGLQGKMYESVKNAIENVLQIAQKNDLIFIGGSNYIVGEALEFFSTN